ncbi:unnamed protein product [Schistocephalus solidus]|uniref:Uncharacterized protein n=1 Tax=Schistocephalus solidus TaxID=70667 RepID=A0A183T2G1_SCHSO|nr:unnamed protein product [Schistocephalus solidus]
MEQLWAALNDIRKEMRAMTVANTASQSICHLPLCKEEAYNDFIGGIRRTLDYANEVATPRAKVTTGGLNWVRVSVVACASTPGMSDSRTSHLPPLKNSYAVVKLKQSTITPAPIPLAIPSRLLRSNRPEWRTALVAWELARYKVDIADLSETRFSEQGQLEEVGAGYTFFWSGQAQRQSAATLVLPLPSETTSWDVCPVCCMVSLIA